MSWRRLEEFSSGPKTRKRSMLAFMMSRRKAPEGPCVFGLDLAGLVQGEPVVAKVGQAERFLDESAVGVGVGAHAAGARWGEFLQLGNQLAIRIEQLLGLLGAHPF